MFEISIINEIDTRISREAIALFQSSRIARGISSLVVNTYLLRGAVAMTLFWLLWFHASPQVAKTRFRLVGTLAAAMLSVIVGRILANFLPFRDRPLASENVMGEAARSDAFLGEWSSMPSDHAMVFCTIAVGFMMVSRGLGLLMMAYAVLVVSLTRIIAGYHYLGDILVGGLIGIIIGIIATPVFARLARALWNRIAIGDSVLARRDIGYAFLFLMTFQFATMFNGARLIAGEFVGFVTGG